MTKRSGISRGDLALALAQVNSSGERKKIAQTFGFRVERIETEKEPEPETHGTNDQEKYTPPVGFNEAPLDAVPFWIPTHYSRLPDKGDIPPKPKSKIPYAGWSNRGAEKAFHIPLCNWDLLEPKLRSALDLDANGSRIDIGKTVDLIAKRKQIDGLPRKARKAFSDGLTIILDRSVHLTPFWYDQDLLVAAMRETFPATLRVLVYDERDKSLTEPADQARPRCNPHEVDGVVLILGDLGFLSGKSGAKHHWRKCIAQFCATQTVCLTPSIQTWQRRDTCNCHVLLWEDVQDIADMSSGPKASKELMAFIRPLVRVEPSLLRALRKKLRPKFFAEVEALVWRDIGFLSKSSVAASFSPEGQKTNRGQFDTLSQEDRQAFLRLVKTWRNSLHEAVWFEELIGLSAQSKALADQSDVEQANAYFGELSSQLAQGGLGGFSSNTLAWMSRVGQRASSSAWENESFRAVFGAMADRDEKIVPECDPSKITTSSISLGQISLTQSGRDLVLTGSAPVGVSNLAMMDAQGANVVLQPLEKPQFPDWPNGGKDACGLWAELEVAGVTQRLRWIEPGRFTIGSPAGEKGRWSDEGPQTEITFASGFWLFDTAVTKAFWAAVMGDELDHAQPEHPKTRVSWNAAQDFIRRLNAVKPGFDLRLPSEAEWEYACRAGTRTPHFFGEKANKDEINFDADGAVAVRDRPANAWGLYQMHGNVWEWCADDWADSHDGIDRAGAPRSVSQQETASLPRVVRGGSWDEDARYVRSAYRNGIEPALSYGNLGFRCASVQVSQASSGGQDDRPQPGREAEPRPGGLAAARPIHLRLPPMQATRTPLPSGPFVLRTDRAELEFQRITKSGLGWASSLGRDRFGFWAQFKLSDEHTPLRWIPPGQFLIGSPEHEDGRFDAEGPQTEITFASGFWLMDAPVTQALWESVMGENPSRFVSKDRPVENVSWYKAQEFISALNGRLDGLALCLPSEAQWEYACRAGTREATYAGPMEIFGQKNAPILNDIAFYGGNSGVGYELEDGADSSIWREKQFAHERAGTRSVRQKNPNSWGCYDLLGNVWEWCADDWAASHDGIDRAGAPRSVSQQETASLSRVVRGGSWIGVARDVRSAARSRIEPEGSSGSLGFRCASVQVSQASSGGQDDRPQPGREAEPRPGTRKGKVSLTDAPNQKKADNPMQGMTKGFYRKNKDILM